MMPRARREVMTGYFFLVVFLVVFFVAFLAVFLAAMALSPPFMFANVKVGNWRVNHFFVTSENFYLLDPEASSPLRLKMKARMEDGRWWMARPFLLHPPAAFLHPRVRSTR